MKFLQTYKRLDTLCRDMNGTGVTGYLEDMEQLLDGERLVPGWKDDYFQLKHYRYLRNQIVHEVNAEEEDLCSAADVAWLEAFYGRILGTNDPLALYHKEKVVPSGPDPWLTGRTSTTLPPAAGSQASYHRAAASSPISYQPEVSSQNDLHAARSTSSESGNHRPAPPPSAPSPPRTGCALWLLFAFCIALFFLSEFFR